MTQMHSAHNYRAQTAFALRVQQSQAARNFASLIQCSWVDLIIAIKN